ncbi:MAG: NADH-quinone oxidoreductase subunit N [Bacteroidetes bacterium]|nr:MAG: NADH-quinone oxidoreductase subunit N [Bacteroidota bacterium]
MNAIILSAIFGVVLMMASAFVSNRSLYKTIALACLVLLVGANIAETLGYSFFTIDTHNMLAFNKMGLFFNTICFTATLLYVFISSSEIERVDNYTAEYFALIFFSLCGIAILTSFNNLLMMFLGIEIMSIPLYILTGSDKRNLKSNEAALKYFLMGSFSTGILLLGIAFIYGATGSFGLESIKVGTLQMQLSILEVTGCILLLIAFAFKVSAAPFHFWTPDVYDGAPSVFTSFMASIIKVAGFYAFVKLFESRIETTSFATNPAVGINWHLLFAILIIATLFVGNITAVFQQSVKRMLAYSSIAQAGFMLFALFSVNAFSKEGLYLYAAGYCLATIGIFAVLVRMKDYTFEGFNGLAKHEPTLAFATTVCLLSLAGIPLTVGFFAKYFMLAAVVKQGYAWLAIVGVLFAGVSIYYYFRVIAAMYFKSADENPAAVATSSTVKIGLAVVVAGIIILGVWPHALLNFLYF